MAFEMKLLTYDSERLTALLPMPALDTHKYARGSVNLVAGSARYPGAACLAALAAQRTGAGFTRVITESTNVALIQSYRASLVVRSWAELTPNELTPTRENRPCAYVVGCGFDPESEPAARITATILEKVEAPVVVDGGGLSFVGTNRGMRLLQRRRMMGQPTVLTPHAGEAARLVRAMTESTAKARGATDAAYEAAADIAADEGAAFDPSSEDSAHLAHSLAKAYGAIVVLKGPDTFIADGKDVVLVDCGTPALAKAGTGDVLAGMIGALLAQGMGTMDAAVLAATLHAQAGRAAAATYTDICVTPEDVIECIPQAVKAVARAADADAQGEPEGAAEGASSGGRHEGGRFAGWGGNHGKR